MDNRLPKRALLISLLVSLIFPTMMYLVLSPLIEDALVSDSTEEAYRVADFMDSHLGLSEHNLTSEGHDDWIKKELAAISVSFGLVEACIIAEDGRVAYSSMQNMSGKRAEVLTKGLLAYSHRQIASKDDVSLNEIIRDIEQMLNKIIGVDIRMRLELADDELVVHADRNQIEQVLLNLINNARDAMPDGGDLLIRTSPILADREFVRIHGFGSEGDRYCLISVKDTGLGMDMDTQERMFEPFFTTKEVGEGTGLGLSIVYGIVTQQGGFIDVTSVPSEGTEVRMYLA